MNKKFLYETLKEFVKDNNLEYGCNVRRLCREKGWHLIPYSGIHATKFLKISQDGFSLLMENEYYIFYNPDKPPTRKKFTIAHEIAHIVLLHHLKVDKKVLAYGGTGYWETQANVFAHNLIIPSWLAAELKEIKSIKEIAEQFEVSEDMVRVRLSKLDTDVDNELDVIFGW